MQFDNRRSIGSWTFENKEYVKFQEFIKWSLERQIKFLEKRLGNLQEVLTFFEEEQLFLATRVNFPGYLIEPIAYDCKLETSKPKDIFTFIKEKLIPYDGIKTIDKNNSKPNWVLPYIEFMGVSKILVPGGTFRYSEPLEINNIISISYLFTNNSVVISTYCDLWSPIDGSEEHYQIDFAVLNTPRLERCLRKIKATGKYDDIYPDEGELGDSPLPQYGFKVCSYGDDITKRADFPKERIEDVKPFIYEYIIEEEKRRKNNAEPLAPEQKTNKRT